MFFASRINVFWVLPVVHHRGQCADEIGILRTIASTLSPRPILWQPNSDVQRAYLACVARIAMMGGGAGSGKTSALIADAAAQTANPKHRAVLFRRDYPSMKHLISSSYALFLPLGATYNKQEHTWAFRSGATIVS